ncbi:MAG: HAD hydrolase family protein [Alistipes sp.]|nr:HAD hydrolase family protein [Alistipes sp.]
MEENFKERLARVEAFVFDVDGVMTDGTIIPLEGGDFIRCYNAKDGYAISYAVKHGWKVCIISGGYGPTLVSRMNRLGIKHLYINCMDKIAALNEFCMKTGTDIRNVMFMGDDIPDLECLRAVGVPVCPADAAVEVIEASCYVSQFAGGRGCVRDVVEQVLRSHNEWALDSKGTISDPNVASR